MHKIVCNLSGKTVVLQVAEKIASCNISLGPCTQKQRNKNFILLNFLIILANATNYITKLN